MGRSRSRSRSPNRYGSGAARPASEKAPKANRRYRTKAAEATGLSATALARQRQQLLQLEEQILATIEARVEEQLAGKLASEEVQARIQARLKEERAKLEAQVTAQLESERRSLLERKRHEAEQARKRQEELDRILEENRRKVEDAQKRAAEERARRDAEWQAALESRVASARGGFRAPV
ncbi:hypothetical protein Agub_g6008 [Astrephomene gubernaculifera]|uniref:Uncharacterized protein n=1 Tax=Astrephomene gubernaculifera TaxID=47775 RepID=A0AAD3DQT0_9CHLO|nr:hypothetical protein Agub_g6008 [Astrephomene gubernaculifera]